MKASRMTPGPTHVLRLATGSDIVESITDYSSAEGVTAGWFSFLGAVSRAGLRYYDQDNKVYVDFDLDQHLEVLSGVGNISLLDGQPFVHTHAAFADSEGRAFGGHLNTGCTVWALEVHLQELEGEALIRQPDDCTGLALWGGTLPC